MKSLWVLLLGLTRINSSIYVLGSYYSCFVTIFWFILGLLGRRDNAVSDTALRIVASMKRDWMQAGIFFLCFSSFTRLNKLTTFTLSCRLGGSQVDYVVQHYTLLHCLMGTVIPRQMLYVLMLMKYLELI
jgi:hypothetical protein